MKVLDAVRRVLRKEGGPLHYKEITERILDQGLWRAEGLTPWNTVNAQLEWISVEMESVFILSAAPGVYGIRGLCPSLVPCPSLMPLRRCLRACRPGADALPDITGKALDLNLIETEGLTPEATIRQYPHRDPAAEQTRGTSPVRETRQGLRRADPVARAGAPLPDRGAQP